MLHLSIHRNIYVIGLILMLSIYICNLLNKHLIQSVTKIENDKFCGIIAER